MLTGESLPLEVKEIYNGDHFRTWQIVITKEDKIHLLKTSRELRDTIIPQSNIKNIVFSQTIQNWFVNNSTLF